MISPRHELAQRLLDGLASGGLDRRRFLTMASALGVAGVLNGAQVDRAVSASETQTRNRQALKGRYDHIVVGSGAAGCIIAARLAEAGADVLLVEAGGGDDLEQVRTPGVWFTNIGGPLDWNLKAAPSPYVNDRRVPVAMGHVLGGGTSINAMLWVRGLAADYDAWAQDGCEGWGFKDVLPVFKSLEDWEGGANAWRGAGGPVHVRTAAAHPHPTAAAFIDASRQLGVPILDDVNGPMREGAGYVNMSIAKDGARDSAARAFLRPALARPNLTLLLNSQVMDLTFDKTRCTGVRMMTTDGARTVAAGEVIVAAGGVNSAKLLMLSGLGDAAALKPLGIAPVLDLPGVGMNFQDHPLLFGVVFKCKGAMAPRSMQSNAVEAAAYVRSDGARPGPDIKMVLMQLPVVTDEIRAEYGAPPADCFTIAPALVRPTGRGSVKLASADWRAPALLETGFLSTDADLAATVRCIEMCRSLGHEAAYDGLRSEELIPGRAPSAEDLRRFAGKAAISFGHQVGSCKMGVDAEAVVDPKLRVHGVEGLRVCDSSIMPRIVTGPTNAATQMIGARAAALILEQR